LTYLSVKKEDDILLLLTSLLILLPWKTGPQFILWHKIKNNPLSKANRLYLMLQLFFAVISLLFYYSGFIKTPNGENGWIILLVPVWQYIFLGIVLINAWILGWILKKWRRNGL